jgi:hypothetical protein
VEGQLILALNRSFLNREYNIINVLKATMQPLCLLDLTLLQNVSASINVKQYNWEEYMTNSKCR